MEWRNRDWVWLVGILTGIMILLIAGFYNSDYIVLNFSIISSAVSIALALLAIFIAIKQDGVSQTINRETSVTLAKITTKIDSMETKIDRLDPNAVTAPAESKIMSEINKIFNSEDGEDKKLEEIKKTISENFDAINNNLKEYYEPNKQFLHYKVTIKLKSDNKEVIDNIITDFIGKYRLRIIGNQLANNTLILDFSSDKNINADDVMKLLEEYDCQLEKFRSSIRPI